MNSVSALYLLISLGILGDATRCLDYGQTKNVFYCSDGIGSIQFTLTFFKAKSAISYLISYKYVMQLKPKQTVENREKIRFRFSGKNRGFGFG